MATHYEELNVVVTERDTDKDNLDEEDENWDDWNSEDAEESEDFKNPEMLCLFCDSLHRSSDSLFKHCTAAHHFDFHAVKNSHGLDFYGCLKLINYVRTQVSQKSCWCCGVNCESKKELQLHLHEAATSNDSIRPWDDDKYLRPLMENDPLLYSFGDNVECEDEVVISVDKEELLRDSGSFRQVCIDNKCGIEQFSSELRITLENGDGIDSLESDMSCADCLEKLTGMDLVDVEADSSSFRMPQDKQLNVSSLKVAEHEIKTINKSYFSSYSSFGIHREMISDKVRTDAYRKAILENPSLFRGAIVMDVGCGTGILSLFASQAGGSRVIAVEASNKMASVAAQIAQDNGLLWSGGTYKDKNHCTGIIEVVQSMVEELDKAKNIEPHSVDVLVSEWMGYCLLYESMLSSVLFARDKWLKPGGAILPDTATMFVAGFGSGGTCLPFWENVYGFNMSCIGKQVVEDAAQLPLVDIIDGRDVVTNTEVLKTFDLVKMKCDEMDFTTKVELAPKMDTLLNCTSDLKSNSISCHGLVLWFETSFSERFCKEMPITLSTSPYATKTHWSQTILTFKEPILMALGKPGDDKTAAVGSDACPAIRIHSRISIARGLQHRSIDISMELSAIGPGGKKRKLPVQMFNLQ